MRFSLSGAVACGAIIMALPLASVAAPAPTTVPAGKVEAPTKATPAPALRAYIDPQTGRLIGHPVTDEQKRAAARSSATPRRNKVLELHHADGSTEYVLNGAADAQIIATVGKDGKIHTHCTDASHQLLPGTTTMQPERRDDR